MPFRIASGFAGSRAIVLPRSVVDEEERDAICKELYVTDIGYYPQAKFHYMQRPVGIDQYVMLYCTGGEGWVEVKGRKFTLQGNQVMVIPAGASHSYGSSDESPWTIYWIHFKGEKAPIYAENFYEPFAIRVAKNSRIEDRLNLFEELYRTLELGYNLDNLRYAASCLHYFMGSLAYVARFRDAKEDFFEGGDVVAHSIHFMKENLNRGLTLDEIAGYMNYSSSHFSMLFRQQTGTSPMNYFARLKVQKACEYLDMTDMKINQICQVLGIEDQFYFSRLFAKFMGVSPKNFRNRNKA